MSEADEVRVEALRKEKEQEQQGRKSLLERQFVMEKKGDYTLYYDKNKPDKVAIREYKDCIVGADKDNNAAIKAIVERVQEKGWTSIKISGNKDLQVALAAEAMDKGIVVDGYEKPKKAQPEKEPEPEKKPQPEKEIVTEEKAKDAHEVEVVEPVEQIRESNIIEQDKVAEEGYQATAAEAEDRRKERQKEAARRLKNPTLEDKGAREDAYNNRSRTDAIQEYPELAPVYEIVSKAREHLEDNRDKYADKTGDAFIQGVRNSCFDELNKGVDLQDRLDKVREQRQGEREKDTQELSLEA